MSHPRPLEGCTNEELDLFDRLATRYSKAVLEYARLASLAAIASRVGDYGRFAEVKLKLDELENECRQCRAALQIVSEECRQRGELRQAGMENAGRGGASAVKLRAPKPKTGGILDAQQPQVTLGQNAGHRPEALTAPELPPC